MRGDEKVRVFYPFPIPTNHDVCVLATVPVSPHINEQDELLRQLELLQYDYDGVLEIFQCPCNREVIFVRLPLPKPEEGGISQEDALFEAVTLEEDLRQALGLASIKEPNNWFQIERRGAGLELQT